MLILVKIGESMYIEDMYNNEYLYFTSLMTFRNKCNDKSGRYDPRELNLTNEQINLLTIEIDKIKFQLHEKKSFNGQFMEYLSDPKINCCSLYLIEIEPEMSPQKLNPKLLEFGDKALLIFDYKIFFEILDISIKKLGLKRNRDKVTYYDTKNYNGKITFHQKNKEFDYQNEYRILIAPTNNEPLKIQLPGLKNISQVVDLIDIETLCIK